MVLSKCSLRPIEYQQRAEGAPKTKKPTGSLVNIMGGFLFLPPAFDYTAHLNCLEREASSRKLADKFIPVEGDPH